MSQSEIEQLSKELARIAGLRLRPPRADESDALPVGELRSQIPEEFFHWRKCPVHGTWLQPELKPFQHWRCASMRPDFMYGFLANPENPDLRCRFQRPAKLRTRIEQRIFAVAAFLEEHA